MYTKYKRSDTCAVSRLLIDREKSGKLLIDLTVSTTILVRMLNVMSIG